MTFLSKALPKCIPALLLLLSACTHPSPSTPAEQAQTDSKQGAQVAQSSLCDTLGTESVPDDPAWFGDAGVEPQTLAGAILYCAADTASLHLDTLPAFAAFKPLAFKSFKTKKGFIEFTKVQIGDRVGYLRNDAYAVAAFKNILISRHMAVVGDDGHEKDILLSRYSDSGQLMDTLSVTGNVGNMRVWDLAALRLDGLKQAFLVEHYTQSCPELHLYNVVAVVNGRMMCLTEDHFYGEVGSEFERSVYLPMQQKGGLKLGRAIDFSTVYGPLAEKSTSAGHALPSGMHSKGPVPAFPSEFKVPVAAQMIVKVEGLGWEESENGDTSNTQYSERWTEYYQWNGKEMKLLERVDFLAAGNAGK